METLPAELWTLILDHCDNYTWRQMRLVGLRTVIFAETSASLASRCYRVSSPSPGCNIDLTIRRRDQRSFAYFIQFSRNRCSWFRNAVMDVAFEGLLEWLQWLSRYDESVAVVRLRQSPLTATAGLTMTAS